jgi:hypothetical protein
VDREDSRPTFSDVAGFVRDWARVPAKKQITPDTQFERDLGITGDDGDELLLAAQKRFKVNFTDGENGVRTIFNLGPNEYLFNSEGFSLGFGGPAIVTLFSNPNMDYSVRAFTVGELSEAVQKAPPVA